jgi:hypothetical protein
MAAVAWETAPNTLQAWEECPWAPSHGEKWSLTNAKSKPARSAWGGVLDQGPRPGLFAQQGVAQFHHVSHDSGNSPGRTGRRTRPPRE